MRKRLLCLLLGLVMIASCALTACSSSDDGEADVSTNTGAKTITMRIITEKKVCNTDEELAKYLEKECGGDETSKKYQDMVATKKAYDAVETKISDITKSSYKINVDILFYTEDEYYDMLETTMAEYALEQKNIAYAKRALAKYIKEYTSVYPDCSTAAITESFYKLFPEYAQYRDASNGSSATGDQYEVNEYGVKTLKYPEADENQLDIVYISGEDMYKRYVENGWLTSLNEHINSTGNKLNYYISPSLMSGVKLNGETYAVPNNVQAGEYTYMLVDKELADKYKYTQESFSDVVDCKYFLEDVVANENGILPIDSSFKECMDMFVWYWNIDAELNNDTGFYNYTINKDNNFSLLGTLYGDPANAGRGQIELGFNSLFTSESYREIFLCLKEYEYNGFYKTANDKRSHAAVSFINGTYAVKKQAEANDGVYVDENGKEYYAYVAKYPQVDNDALYGNMFGISANSKNAEACMRVITLINTDSEVRNLLQYGIKQGDQAKDQTANYAIDEESGVLTRLNDLYMMDINKTGNCFIAYPEEGLPADYWEDAKVQSNETLIDPLLGFDFDERLAEYSTSLDNDVLAQCDKLAAEKLAEIEKCKTYEELYELVEAYGTLFKKDPQLADGTLVNFGKITNKNYDVSTGADGEADMNGESPYTVYYKWLVQYGYTPAS